MSTKIYKIIKYIFFLFPIMMMLFSCQTFAQQAEFDDELGEDSNPIKIDSVLVNIPITVLDKENNFVHDLTIEDFIVYSDQKRQTISIFETHKDPLEVVIMLDVSDSIKQHFNDIKKSATNFIKMLRPSDRAMIVTFDCKLHVLNYFSNDHNLLSLSINGISSSLSSSGTCIYDSLGEVIENYFKKSRKSRKAIILLTDGVDNNSRRSFSNLRDSLANSSVVIYNILYNTPASSKKSKNIMQQLVDFTGGRNYKAEESNTRKIFGTITRELQNQYQLGFYPDSMGENDLHDIKVEVARPKVKIKTRQSYYLKR